MTERRTKLLQTMALAGVLAFGTGCWQTDAEGTYEDDYGGRVVVESVTPDGTCTATFSQDDLPGQPGTGYELPVLSCTVYRGPLPPPDEIISGTFLDLTLDLSAFPEFGQPDTNLVLVGFPGSPFGWSPYGGKIKNWWYFSADDEVVFEFQHLFFLTPAYTRVPGT